MDLGVDLIVPNQSLEPIGEQLAVMEQTARFETETMNQPALHSTRLTLS